MEKKALRISYDTSEQKQGPPQKKNTSFSLRSPGSPPKNAEKKKKINKSGGWNKIIKADPDFSTNLPCFNGPSKTSKDRGQRPCRD